LSSACPLTIRFSGQTLECRLFKDKVVAVANRGDEHLTGIGHYGNDQAHASGLHHLNVYTLELGADQVRGMGGPCTLVTRVLKGAGAFEPSPEIKPLTIDYPTRGSPGVPIRFGAGRVSGASRTAVGR
jgi:hypothetical protein